MIGTVAEMVVEGVEYVIRLASGVGAASEPWLSGCQVLSGDLSGCRALSGTVRCLSAASAAAAAELPRGALNRV